MSPFSIQAFGDSLNPHMLTEVLQVLRLDTGKAIHADKIEQAYHEQLDKHKQCENCPKDTTQ